MMRALLVFALLMALVGCETVPDVDHARYEKIQREVDAYYRCGQHEAYGMATTVLRPRDIATAARGACKRKRDRVIHAIQRCYDSAIWSRLTIDIDQAFRNRAVAVVIDRRQALRSGKQVAY